MKQFFYCIVLIVIMSCGRGRNDNRAAIITVSIPPFKYFVREIAGDKFDVNVMVPPGSNPHIYEPYPEQVNMLMKSSAYISNGYLGFEMTWLDRFYEMNRGMKKLSLGDGIEPMRGGDDHEGSGKEAADPHYWVSPKSAFGMAERIRDFLTVLDRGDSLLFELNYKRFVKKITEADSCARLLTTEGGPRSFMIYHPNLAYLARDYGLEEIAVEYDGKEPSPARLKYLIDRAKAENLKVILVQREYDSRNARAIADETGSRVVIIDPLAEDWYRSTMNIIEVLKDSFANNTNK
ncbi:MAG: zinc ABC transporter substrate-binding protein [Bacteroidales bacterium]